VLGGTTDEPLRIAYELEEEVRGVTIQVEVGSRVIRSFQGRGTKGRTFRFSLPARSVARGKTANVLVGADRGGPVTAVELTANRL
jgi:hypothetical protein